MAAPFTTAMLALSPDSFWLCGESGATLADSVGGKDLAVRGAPDARTVAPGGIFIGVDPGINFGNTTTKSYGIDTSPLTQIASNKFSVVGMFQSVVLPTAFSMPLFCASFSGGHSDPFYIFGMFNNGSNNQRLVVDTSGTFVPMDTAVAWPAIGAWHLIGFTYDGTTTTTYVDNAVSATSAIANGALANSMGSFALNCIPALDATANAGATMAASVGYWHDYLITPTNMNTLWTAAQAPPAPSQAQTILPGSVSAALRV